MTHSGVRDLTQTTLAVVALGTIIAAALWVMAPFLAATVWATMIVIATWPILLWLQGRLWGRRWLAVTVMLVPLLALLVIPVAVTIWLIAANADRLTDVAKSLLENGLPQLPDWIVRLPFLGGHAAAGWSELSEHSGAVAERLFPHVGDAARWLLAKAGGFGTTILQLLITVVISGILYASGESAARGVRRFVRRLAGERGDNAAVLAAKAVRAVALGIVVTALSQTAIAGIGLFVAGVPAAGLLTAAVLVLCIAQIGPIPVMVPATIWLYVSGATGRGTTLLIFTVVAGTVDNLIRPVLIKKGADLPLLLIIAGVVGGLLGFGVVGLFVGPVILAVAWTLVSAWVADLDRPTTAP